MTALYLVNRFRICLWKVPLTKVTLSGRWRWRQGRGIRDRSRSTQDRPRGRAHPEWCLRSCQEDSRWETARRGWFLWGSHNSRGGAWRPERGDLTSDFRFQELWRYLKPKSYHKGKYDFTTFHSSIEKERRKMNQQLHLNCTVGYQLYSQSHSWQIECVSKMHSHGRFKERYTAKAKDLFLISKICTKKDILWRLS